MWLLVLSDQLSIVALGSHYLPNQLIDRRLIPRHPCGLCFSPFTKRSLCGLVGDFSPVFLTLGADHPRVTHPSATPLPSSCEDDKDVRLACVRHAASVYPEPGSNSPFKCSIANLFTEIPICLFSSEDEMSVVCHCIDRLKSVRYFMVPYHSSVVQVARLLSLSMRLDSSLSGAREIIPPLRGAVKWFFTEFTILRKFKCSHVHHMSSCWSSMSISCSFSITSFTRGRNRSMS